MRLILLTHSAILKGDSWSSLSPLRLVACTKSDIIPQRAALCLPVFVICCAWSTGIHRDLYDPSMQEHRESQMAQNSWREITATHGKDQMSVWFTNVTVVPDEDLRVKSLHFGCAHKYRLFLKENTVP